MSILEESFSTIHKRLENKEITVSELVDASFKRINEVDDKVKAFLTLNEEEARSHAKNLDEALEKEGVNGAFSGYLLELKITLRQKVFAPPVQVKFSQTLSLFMTPQ